MSNDKHIVDISFASILRALLLGVGAWLLFVLRDIVLLVFTAFIIGSGLYLVGRFLQTRFRIPYKVGVIGTVIGGVIVAGALIYPLVPSLVEQISNFREEQVPTLIERAEQYWEETSTEEKESFSISSEKIGEYTRKVAGGVLFTTRNILSGAVYTLVLVVISLYLALEPRNLESMIAEFWPETKQQRVRQKVSEARDKVGQWILGQVIIALILGVLSYLILIILKVENPLLLGVIAGVFNMIPFIGPILGLVPAAVMGFLQSVQTGVAVIIAYIVLQQIEGNFLTPTIMNKVTGFSHVLIIISILVGGTLAGALGAIIAIPFMSVLSLFVEGLRPQEES